MDRRVQASQQKLLDALRVLMQRYPWESITVATICQESGISRSTFYSHFSTREELMQLSLVFLARDLTPADTRRGLDRSCTLKFVPELLEHIRHHRDIMEKNRDTAAAGIIMRNLRKTIDGLVVEELRDSSFSTTISQTSIVFICGGLMAIIEQWNEDGCRASVRDTVKIVDTQIQNALKSIQTDPN